jgi:hypothetical protein
MSEPWICPRCKVVNAPFNVQCFCKPTNSYQSLNEYANSLDGLTAQEIKEKFNQPEPTPHYIVGQTNLATNSVPSIINPVYW